MDLARVIIGPVSTEKSERQKQERTYTLRVNPRATKVDVKAALHTYYDVKADSIRVMNVCPKTRSMRRTSGVMRKRHPFKKALVTLTPDSKPLDITAFRTP